MAHLKPERLEIEPTDPDATRKFKHWLATVKNYISSLDATANKLHTLINFVGHQSYTYIENETTYEDALRKLKSQYEKPVNSIYARHILATRKQLPEETLDDFLRNLRILARDCDFKDVTADIYQQEAIRDSFIAGIRSSYIRQRLLENDNINLDTAFTTARSLEIAQKNSETYNSIGSCAATNPTSSKPLPDSGPSEPLVAASRAVNNNNNKYYQSNSRCYFCGNSRHPRFKCPARDFICSKCQRKGHFPKVCQSNPSGPGKMVASTVDHEPSNESVVPNQSSWPPVLWAITQSCATSQSNNHPLSKSMTKIQINNQNITGVIDSASSYSFLHPKFAQSLKLNVSPATDTISMASQSLTSQVSGCCYVNLRVKDRSFNNFKFLILPNLCTQVILGLDFLSLHKSVTMNYGGQFPALTVCGLSTLKMDPPSLFSNLTPNCKPIADKSRKYSADDLSFIKTETERLLKEDIIEESHSPWRAQVVVVKKGSKRRLAIDYSQTINLFTFLDAYPLPNLTEHVNRIAAYRVYSKIDLRQAYHQVPIKPEDKPFTAFQANNKLFQFKRLPFGVTNGVSVFQRQMDYIVEKYQMEGTFPYMDDVTICGDTQEDHDRNLNKFLSVAKALNLTLNEEKSTFSVRKLTILGCVIEEGTIRPDPERFKPLEALPPPHDSKSLKRCLGFFAYYAKWIPNFSDKIRPLNKTTSFPISTEAQEAITKMKEDIRKAVLCYIDESLPFTLECDASEYAIAATLNQQGRPVGFFTRTLQSSELKYPSVEKEAMSIIESVRNWRHLLAPRKFTIVTDQRSISFMFNTTERKKVKNEKILRWRLELSTYNYDIHYRPGKLNESPDALSRICATTVSPDLKQIHIDLCHPGVTRLLHFVKARNLPFSVEEVRSVIKSCSACAECKPQFYKSNEQAHLIKATQPLERLNLDFKGPLPSNNKNKFFLNVVDEFSRFCWVFPCSDVSSTTVSKCLTELFTTFGLPQYIHSDRGSSFISSELRQFLSSKGIATSRTTSYNPRCNGQVEKENGTIWRAINLALKSKGLPLTSWQDVLPEVLHATRSLLCTSTNQTPHERMFKYPRKTTSGTSLPTWLSTPGPVLLRSRDRKSKNDPLVEPVQLLHANPSYAFIKFSDGREDTVSLRDLAPVAENSLPSAESTSQDTIPSSESHSVVEPPVRVSIEPEKPMESVVPSDVSQEQSTPIMSGKVWCDVNPENIITERRRK